MKTLIHCTLALSLASLLAACGGGSSSTTGVANPATLTPPSKALVRVSQASPYPAGCGGGAPGSVSYEDAEVEPYMAINPANPSNLVGAWQQDRFSDGGAHGLVAGSSMDGGKTWKEHVLPFSVCGGGTAGNGGDYARASDPWVSIAKDGSVAYVISISFSGNTLQPGSTSAVLVSRSIDGGVNWSDPTPLKLDGANAFNDKESITADPVSPLFAYAVWDRLTDTDHGAAMFARTIDGGTTWQPAVAIYDPGVGNQTIGNEIVGLSDGTIIDLFEEIDNTATNNATARIRLIRSADQGATWSKPVDVANNLAVGVSDPNTGDPIRSGAGIPQAAAGPGTDLAVVWQDGRFSGGAHDDIAYAGSSDGGLHWTAPVQINSVLTTPAFTPSVAILADGTVGVTYFDFRKDSPSQDVDGVKTLPTDYWFTSSTDGVHWSEQHITGPFDLREAPIAEGFFVGDYEVLGKVGSVFVPFFVQTTATGTADRTDAFFLPPQPKPLSVTRRVTKVVSQVTATEPDAGFRGRVHENLMRVLRNEDPVWDKIRAERQVTGTPP